MGKIPTSTQSIADRSLPFSFAGLRIDLEYIRNSPRSEGLVHRMAHLRQFLVCCFDHCSHPGSNLSVPPLRQPVQFHILVSPEHAFFSALRALWTPKICRVRQRPKLT